MHYAQMRQAHILFVSKYKRTDFIRLAFYLCRLKISDQNADHLFGGGKDTKSPLGRELSRN